MTAGYLRPFLALVVVLAALLPFLAVPRLQFVAFDDDDNVYQNPYLNPVTAKSVPHFWSEDYYELYTPVTYTIWTAVASLPGSRMDRKVLVLAGGDTTLAAAPFHTVGILVHAANALLVFLLLARIPALRERSPIFPAIGALFWAVHPLQVEPVAWITGNNNVFSGFFLLLALLLFIRRLEATTENARTGWFLGASVLYGLALLAKPTAAVLPLVALVIARCLYRTAWRDLVLPIGTWLLLAGALLFVTRNTATPVTDVSLPVWQRPFVVGDAVTFYLRKSVLPWPLGIDYGRRPEWLRAQWWSYLVWLLPALLGGALYRWRHRARNPDLASSCLCGFLVLIAGALPMLGIVPYYFHRYSTVTDRYVYISLIGPALVVAVLLAAVPVRWQRAALGGAAALLVLFGALSYRQTRVWHDSRSLFEHTVKVNPGSMMGHNNLSLVLRDAGDAAGAWREIERAVHCPPQGNALPAVVHTTRGVLLVEQGRLPEAIPEYQEAIRIDPGRILAYKNLALIYNALGDTGKARETLDQLLRLPSKETDREYRLGVELIQKDLLPLGIPYLERTAVGNGRFAGDANYILGVLAGNRGQHAAAEQYFRVALGRRTNRADRAETAYSLARTLAREGKTAEARTYFAQAAQLGYRPAPGGSPAPKPVQ